MSKQTWRPEGWDKIVANQYPDASVDMEEQAGLYSFEDGADAMLEALRKSGVNYLGGDAYLSIGDRRWKLEHAKPAIYKGGAVVIIPDDECSSEKQVERR